MIKGHKKHTLQARIAGCVRAAINIIRPINWRSRRGAFLFVFGVIIGFPAKALLGQTISAREVKEFLENPPAIENFTYAILNDHGKSDTNGFSRDGKLYLAQVQSNNFVIAELKTPGVMPHMTTRTLPIGGRIDSQRWSIYGMTLNFGPTNGVSDEKDPALTVSTLLEHTLDTAMNLGIYHAAWGTLHVSESGEFNCIAAPRILLSWGPDSQIHGHFTFSTEGKLNQATWVVTTRPQLTFFTEYHYASPTNSFPSSWDYWVNYQGTNLLKNEVKIFEFQLASSLLPNETFRPERFIIKSNLPSIGPIVLARDNGTTLWKRDGKFSPVKIEEPGPGLPASGPGFWAVRIVLLAFVVGGIVLILRAFASAKKTQ